MNYLKYGKQVQQQPQKPQPQGFGKDEKNVKISNEDFKFGDLTGSNNQIPKQQVSPPPSSPQKGKDELLQAFPTPILVCSCPIDYSREKKWCLDYDCDKHNSDSEKSSYNRQSKDTFILDNPELKRIREFIQQKIDVFVSQIYKSTDKLIITQSWLNKSGRGESHHHHQHPNSVISGVWYPSINPNLPPITFDNARMSQIQMRVEDGSFNNFNSSYFTVPMNDGELILFPSGTFHRVAVNISDDERVSLSFNTWVKGSIGNKEKLTYLPLDRCV